MPDALYWDTLDPYHYVRLQPGPGNHDYLIVGGADHKTGEADDAWARFDGIEVLDAQPRAGARQGDASLVRPDPGPDRLQRLHRPQPGDKKRLCRTG